MAANRKSSTSKTARVMNLLSKNREEPIAEQPSVPAAAPAPAPQTPPPATAVTEPAPAVHTPPSPPAAPTTPLISSMQADSVISNQVMSALESALDSELGVQQPPQQPAAAATKNVTPVEPETEHAEEPIITPEVGSVPEPATESASAPIIETAAEPIPEPVAETVAEPVIEMAAEAASTPADENVAVVVPEPVAAEAPTIVPVAAPSPTPVQAEPKCESAPSSQFKIDSNTTYVNVMETLVEEKAARYIEMFGLCKCPRCVADVKALALNNLNPKYVVMRTGEVIPRITLYENQFSAAVTAQILNACKVVMNSPRHDQQ